MGIFIAGEGPGWEHSKAIGGDLVEALRSLKASEGRALHGWGSSALLQTWAYVLIPHDVNQENKTLMGLVSEFAA